MVSITLRASELPLICRTLDRCQALFEIKDNEEKDSAFRGFCTLIQRNPAGIAKVELRGFDASR